MSVLFNLYSSEGCHLCEQALELILKNVPQSKVNIIDIVESEHLVELYGVHIPVLERLTDNTKLFWPFEETQVVELI